MALSVAPHFLLWPRSDSRSVLLRTIRGAAASAPVCVQGYAATSTEARLTISTASPVILVVISDDDIRRLVGWVIAEMNLTATLTENWRSAIVATAGQPSCIIADLVDAGDRAAGVAVLRKSWGGVVPLVILSRQADVERRAAGVGAVAGLRKPINVGALMETIGRSMDSRGTETCW